MAVRRIPTRRVFCPECGQSNRGTASFCMKCGSSLADDQGYEDENVYEPTRRYAPQASANGARMVSPVFRNVTFAIIGLTVFALSLYAGVALFKPGGISGLASGNPPSYVKALSVLKEGTKQFSIYFILADNQGGMTRADGTAVLTISQSTTDYKTNTKSTQLLWSGTIPVAASDFQQTTVGQGAFAHDALLYPIGRLAYSAFSRMPTEFSGVAHLTFTPAHGTALEADENILFDQ